MESLYKDASPLYEEALSCRLDYVYFPHEGETLKLLEIEAIKATMRLFEQEGRSSIDRLNREVEALQNLLEKVEQKRKEGKVF
jgi:hypothetical protein